MSPAYNGTSPASGRKRRIPGRAYQTGFRLNDGGGQLHCKDSRHWTASSPGAGILVDACDANAEKGRCKVRIVAEGKEAVMQHLEATAKTRLGESGPYMLMEDDSGTLIAFLAGYSFIGTGSIALGGQQLVVKNGLVMAVQQS